MLSHEQYSLYNIKNELFTVGLVPSTEVSTAADNQSVEDDLIVSTPKTGSKPNSKMHKPVPIKHEPHDDTKELVNFTIDTLSIDFDLNARHTTTNKVRSTDTDAAKIVESSSVSQVAPTTVSTSPEVVASPRPVDDPDEIYLNYESDSSEYLNQYDDEVIVLNFDVQPYKDGDAMELDDEELYDEGHDFAGFPKVLIRDAKLITRGSVLIDLLSR